MKNMVIALFGESGVGKTTTQHYLAKKYNALPIITHTTRVPRKNEKNGVDYYFNSVDQFKKLNLLEYTKYDHSYYGSAKDDLDRAWKNGHHLLSIVLDYKGVQSYINRIPKQVIPIYLFTDEDTIINRLHKRGMPEDDMKNRIQEHKQDLNQIYNVIFNHNVRVQRVDATNPNLKNKDLNTIIKSDNTVII